MQHSKTKTCSNSLLCRLSLKSGLPCNLKPCRSSHELMVSLQITTCIAQRSDLSSHHDIVSNCVFQKNCKPELKWSLGFGVQCRHGENNSPQRHTASAEQATNSTADLLQSSNCSGAHNLQARPKSPMRHWILAMDLQNKHKSMT